MVDAQTSVVIKARLDGRIGVAADAGDAELRLVLESAMTEIGRQPAINAPADALPDEDKPLGIAAALERFGVERTDAGVTLSGPISAPSAPAEAPSAAPDSADDNTDDDDGPPIEPDAPAKPTTTPKPAPAGPKVPKPPKPKPPAKGQKP